MSEPAPPIHPTTPPSTTPGPPPIELVPWPERDDRRLLLAALGRPRLLLLAPAAPPPPQVDDLELSIPDGSDPLLIATALAALQQKVRMDDDAEPHLDDDGLLWFRGGWVAVPDGQLPVIDLLVRNYQRLVRNDDLLTAYQRAGGSGTIASLRALVVRIGNRLGPIGLELKVVRRRGVLLTHKPSGPN